MKPAIGITSPDRTKQDPFELSTTDKGWTGNAMKTKIRVSIVCMIITVLFVGFVGTVQAAGTSNGDKPLPNDGDGCSVNFDTLP